MRPLSAVLVVVFASAGCASDKSTELIAPDTYAIDCSGGAPNWVRCHTRARAACKNGDFEIQSQVSNARSAGVGTNDWSTAGSQITRTMVVKCR